MKKITVWHPDTCKCVISYEWDTDDPPETRQHVIVSHDNTLCPAHAVVKDGAIEAHPVHQENSKKNLAIGSLAESCGFTVPVIAEGREPTDEEQAQIDAHSRFCRQVRFTHDQDRKLTLTAPVDAALVKDLKNQLVADGHPDVELLANG